MNRRTVLQYATASAIAFAATPATAADATLRVGSNLGEPYSEAYFANELGYFTARSLSVALPIYAQGGTMAAAVAAGNLDIAVNTPVSIAAAVSRGIPFVIIAAGAISTLAAPVTPVVVSASSTIQGPRDLAGKTVAVNGLHASSELALDAWLAHGGVDPAQVKPIEMSFGEMAPALARGTIAAAIIGEPTLTIASKSQPLRRIGNPYSVIAPNCMTSCWFTTSAFARENAAAVSRFAAAIYAAGAWANTHHDDSAAMLAKVAKLDVATIRSMTRTNYAARAEAADLQPLLDVALKFGYLQKPVSAAALLYPA